MMTNRANVTDYNCRGTSNTGWSKSKENVWEIIFVFIIYLSLRLFYKHFFFVAHDKIVM